MSIENQLVEVQQTVNDMRESAQVNAGQYVNILLYLHEI